MAALEEIRNHLENVPGAAVQITNAYHSWLFEKKHGDCFKQDSKGSLYMRSGKRWLCISGCKIRLGQWVKE